MDALLGTIIESSLDGIFAFSQDLKFTVWNPAMERISGFSGDAVLRRSVFEAFPHIRGTVTEQNYRNVLMGKKIYIEEQAFTHLITKEKGYFEANWAPLENSEKKIVGGVCIVRDITKRKLAEEDSYRFFDESTELHFISSIDGSKRRRNPAFEKLLGYSNAELDKMDIKDLIHPDDIGPTLAKLAASVEGKRETSFENRYICKDGKIRTLSWNSIVKNDRVYATARDITEIREMEKKLAERDQMLIYSSKMATLGQMAGGIAHEINTPLATISMTTQVLKQMMSDNKMDFSFLKKQMDIIELTAFRIAKIVSGLKMFSRDAKKDPIRMTSVKSIIDETLALCMERFKDSNVELEVSEVSEFLTLNCRGVQISQVLLNLLNNSFDAVRESREKKSSSL